jgi:hypothetical protein
MQPIKRSAPAAGIAALHRFTLLEEVVVISVSMLDRLCNRVEFLRAFAYLNTISKREFQGKRGNHLQLHSDTLANRQSGSYPETAPSYDIFACLSLPI